MLALIYEITQVYDILGATGNDSEIQIPKIKIRKIVQIKARFVFQLLDPTSTSNPFQETSQPPQQMT